MAILRRYGLLWSAMLLSTWATAGVDHSVALSVVQVHATPTVGAKIALGSGVVVQRDRVVTNCHVIRDAQTVVVSKGALRFEATAERTDFRRDLCILEVPSLAVKVAKIGSADRLKRRDPVYLYGFPRAVGITFSQGEVISLHSYRGSSVIETSAGFMEGSSGGGVFNDSGRLVGISTFFSAGPQRHYFALPAEWIRLVSKLPKRDIRPIPGQPFWQEYLRLPGFLQLPRRG